ncbi:MAG: thioredoxin family protein [Deltaproteobacteria bacterium]|nr:thioredoxin family protein [Deltaproteobacteria bacterium]
MQQPAKQQPAKQQPAKQPPAKPRVVAPPRESSGAGWAVPLALALSVLGGGAWYLRERDRVEPEASSAQAAAPTPAPAQGEAEAQLPEALEGFEPPEDVEPPAGGAEPGLERPAKLEPAPPRALPTLPHSAGFSEGADAYASALDELRSKGLPVLVYVGADWCPYCKQLEAQVLPDSKVERAISVATKVKLYEGDPADKALFGELGITGYPTLLLFTAAGQPPRRIRSGVARGRSPNPRDLVESFTETVSSAWSREAHDALSEERYDDAIEAADRALAFQSDDPGGRLQHLRGLAFFKKRAWSEALRDFLAACQAGNQADCQYAAQRER